MRTRATRNRLLSRPTVRWEVDLQQIVACLSGQRLPFGARGISWSVRPGECSPPQVRVEGDSRRLEEMSSEPLPPSTSYALEVVVQMAAGVASPAQQRRFDLPDDFTPCVLFAHDGTLIPEDADPLQPGEYLALVPKAGVAALRARGGVEMVERIPVGPVGWHGWQGWRLALAPEADVAPYRVEAAPDTATWEVELPPASSVAWRETLPIWTGGWPRLFIANSAAFADAVLIIDHEPASVEDSSLFLKVGSDVPVRVEPQSGRSFLDLHSAPAARNCYGRLRLQCRPLLQHDGPAPIAHFVRLPAMRLGYAEDPKAPTAALAVRVRFDDPVLAIEPEPDTEVLSEGGAFLLRAQRPHLSPGVSARLPGQRAEMRVRVPVTRGRLVSAAHGTGGWQSLPICGLDLAAVSLDDRLRLEFHESPATEDGHLLFRLSGVGEAVGGESLGQAEALHVYEIDLHRWRDRFGVGAGGMVQVRARSRWFDVAQLGGHAEPELPTLEPVPPVPEGERGRLLASLEKALEVGDRASVFSLSDECFSRSVVAGAVAGDAELLPLAAGRAVLAVASTVEELGLAIDRLADLSDRTDLPEALLLRETLALRREGHTSIRETWSQERVERLGHALPDIPGKALLLAEAYYHYARHLPGGAPAFWQSCLELTERFLAVSGLRELRSLKADGLLLRELARLNLAKPPLVAELPPTDDIRGTWIAAARHAGHSIRAAGGRGPGATPPRLPLLSPCVLRPEDVALLRVTTAQGRGESAPEDAWALLRHWQPGQFFAIRLLRARQARLQGQIDEARAEYDRLLAEVLDRGPDDLLDVVTKERPA